MRRVMFLPGSVWVICGRSSMFWPRSMRRLWIWGWSRSGLHAWPMALRMWFVTSAAAVLTPLVSRPAMVG